MSLRQHLAAFFSHTGRPSIDPALMIRMLLIGYWFGIRSERRLCEEVHLNLAYRSKCGIQGDVYLEAWSRDLCAGLGRGDRIRLAGVL